MSIKSEEIGREGSGKKGGEWRNFWMGNLWNFWKGNIVLWKFAKKKIISKTKVTNISVFPNFEKILLHWVY